MSFWGWLPGVPSAAPGGYPSAPVCPRECLEQEEPAAVLLGWIYSLLGPSPLEVLPPWSFPGSL